MSTARNHIAITPSDSTAVLFDALYVGGAGNVTCLDHDGTSVLYVVPAGGYVLTTVTKVMATGTTATGIVGLQY